MNRDARRDLDAICNQESFPASTLTQLERLGDFSQELALAIEQASTKKRWGCVCRLVWVAQRFPNHSPGPCACQAPRCPRR